MWFSYLPQSYGRLSDNFFVIHASLYYSPSGFCSVSKFCILSAVSATDVCEFMQELNQKESFTGSTITCHIPYTPIIVHFGVIQHILFYFQKRPL